MDTISSQPTQAPDSATRPGGGLRPGRLFAIFAFAEMVTWALLLLGMFLKYVTQTTELGVRVFGTIHGFVFLTYCVVVLLVAIDQRWSRGVTLLGLLSAVPPFATVPFERYVERRGLIGREWAARTGREPQNPVERVAAWAVLHPVVAGLAALVLVTLLFAVLLALGPPVPAS